MASLSLGSIAAMHFRLRGGNHKKELTLMLRHVSFLFIRVVLISNLLNFLIGRCLSYGRCSDPKGL